MFAFDIAKWFTVVMLIPVWWSMALLLIALLGDFVPGWRGPVLHLFDRLEGRHPESTRRIEDVPDRRAA